MGLFDFMSDIGNKIFGSEEEAPEKIKEHIAEDNPGVKDLEVEVKDGVATLKGEAESPGAFEKAVLMVGNMFGIKEVKADELAGSAEDTTEYYEIKKGDTLWAIAEKAYGNGAEYKRIFEENREVIKDPDLIFVGQKIRIPK